MFTLLSDEEFQSNSRDYEFTNGCYKPISNPNTRNPKEFLMDVFERAEFTCRIREHDSDRFAFYLFEFDGDKENPPTHPFAIVADFGNPDYYTVHCKNFVAAMACLNEFLPVVKALKELSAQQTD